MNQEQVRIVVIAKQVGLPIQAKINQILMAPPSHTGPYRVPIYPSPAVPPIPPDYVLPLSKSSVFEVVDIGLELYRDERGNELWLGYNEKYSILVWKPQRLMWGFEVSSGPQ